MATIVYLDAEDEITSAAAQIRAAADSRVGLVLPFGSRVATSRINFRLLAREAMSHGRRLDIVAPDASAGPWRRPPGCRCSARWASTRRRSTPRTTRRTRGGRRRARPPASRRCGRDRRSGGGNPLRHGAQPPINRATRRLDRRRPKLGAKARGASSARPAPPRPPPHPVRPSSRIPTVRRPRRRRRLHGALARGHAGRQGRRRGRRLGAIVGALLVLAVVIGAVGAGAYLLLPSASITVTPGSRTSAR